MDQEMNDQSTPERPTGEPATPEHMTGERRPAAIERRPFRDLEEMSDRMRRVMDYAFGGFAWPAFFSSRMGWAPPIDLEETDDAYVVEAELPSVKPQDVDVELVGNDVEITGVFKDHGHTGVMHRRGRRTGSFSYRVTLPSTVDAEQVDANIADGVLVVRVPKSQRDDRRRIDVKST